MKTKPQFPITVAHKGFTAKIYRESQFQNGKEYPGLAVVYFDKGKRKRIRRKTLDAAQIAAKNICSEMSIGEHLTLELKNGERLTYMRAIEPVKAIGVALDVAACKYADIIKRLPEGMTIDEVLDIASRRNITPVENRTVKQVVGEMLTAKESAGLSDAYQHDMKVRLGRFADDFQMNIGEVTGAMLQAWIDNLKVKGSSKTASGRSRFNYVRAIAELFRFAIRRKWLLKDALDEVQAVQLPKDDSGEPDIFTADEMAEILAAARPEMIPFIVIGGFAGLRSAEIARLDWSEVNIAERFIEIKKCKAKTASRRLAPITDNLAKWLVKYAKKEGDVVPFKMWWNQLPNVVQAVNDRREKNGQPGNFEWRHNALRHSFCSYRLAAINDAAKVALEAGNSPQMIFQHYRQVVTESEAAKWFSIAPPKTKQGRKLVLGKLPSIKRMELEDADLH